MEMTRELSERASEPSSPSLSNQPSSPSFHSITRHAISNMPYNLSRWATYPRASLPRPPLIVFLETIKDSKKPVFPGPEIRTLLSSEISSATISQHRSSDPSSVLENAITKEQSQSPSEEYDAHRHPGMPTQASTNDPETSASPGSSDETFETANSDNLGSTEALAQGTESSAGSEKSTTISDATEKPEPALLPGASQSEGVQLAQTLQATPPTTEVLTISLQHAEPTPSTLGNKHSSRHSLGTIFHGKSDRDPPPVPPKVPKYIAAVRQLLQGNQKQPAVQKAVQENPSDKSIAPTMLIFKVLGTRTNPDTRQCEYHLLYKWSGKDLYFPRGQAIEEVFTFEDFSMHKAVVTRLRTWHSTHIGVSKDPRVEEMKYRLSPAEYTEINRYEWPPFDPRGWYRCLIWGHFGIESDNE
ncbi:hypothetical protein TWF718_006499 [Orbilia javanica]|uniref:Uncharacterized protein n=1 Tax=Orbilia javanica TaxID=47235 RepID=A0AAN8N0Y6_9PEZI